MRKESQKVGKRRQKVGKKRQKTRKEVGKESQRVGKESQRVGKKSSKDEERGRERESKGGEREQKSEERGRERESKGGEKENTKWGKGDSLFEEKIIAKEDLLGIKLSETRKNILRLMYNNPTITTAEIMQILKINRSAVDKHIKSMRNVFLKNVGCRRYAKWQILLD